MVYLINNFIGGMNMHCKIVEDFYEIIRMIEEDKKKPKDYGGGVLLYHAEVIFLDEIARSPGENVSGLSARLGITKGAVTQMSAKLEQKKLLIATRRHDNKKEKYFRLTPAGEEVIQGHLEFHRQANQKLCDYFSTLDLKEQSAIFRFFEFLRQCVPLCEFPCGYNNEYIKEAAYDESRTAQCTKFTGSSGNRN